MKKIFTSTSACLVEDVVSGSMGVEEMDMRQEWYDFWTLINQRHCS